MLHRLCHVLTYADHVLVAHDVAHTMAWGVAHGVARDTALVLRSTLHAVLCMVLSWQNASQ